MLRLATFGGLCAAVWWSAGACTMGPNYRAPDGSDLPTAFSQRERAATQAATAPSSRPVDLAVWWTSLDDQRLNQLVSRSLHDNYDLKIAVARLQEARENEAAITGGVVGGFGRFLSADASAAAARGTGNNSTRGRTGPVLQAGTITSDWTEVTHAAGIESALDVDLFGRYARLAESSHADTQAVAEATNEVLVNLIADVVRAYVEVRGAQFRLDVARQNVAVQQQTLQLVRERLDRGLGSELDVALAERLLSTTLANLAPLEAALSAGERRVAVLLGVFPEQLEGTLREAGPLPAAPPDVAPGMPLDLIRRRPDVRRAERTLAANTARIGLATAEMFPRIGASGAVGIQGQGLGLSPVRAHAIYTLGPSFYWPVLDFGRLEAAALAQDYRTQQSLFAYKKAVVTAVQEVDDALSNYASERDRLNQLGNAVIASTRAAKLAQGRYENGLTDFLNVLDAQRQMYDLQDQYAVGQLSLLRQFISLYRALGGGWEGYVVSPPPAPRPAIIAAGAALMSPNQPRSTVVTVDDRKSVASDLSHTAPAFQTVTATPRSSEAGAGAAGATDSSVDHRHPVQAVVAPERTDPPVPASPRQSSVSFPSP